MRQFIVILEHDDGGIWSYGVFNDCRTAIGAVMEEIWTEEEDFKKDKTKNKYVEYSYTAPYDLEGDAGIGISVTWKTKKGQRKPNCKYWFILFDDSEETYTCAAESKKFLTDRELADAIYKMAWNKTPSKENLDVVEKWIAPLDANFKATLKELCHKR